VESRSAGAESDRLHDDVPVTDAPQTWIAGLDEAPTAARLLCEFRDWWGSSEPSDEDMLASVLRVMAGGDGEYLLGASDADGAPAGVAQIRFRWSVWKTAPDCWLEDLYVRETARRAGLGRALVEAAVARARERGCRRIELDVNEQNEVALALYTACGFTLEPKPPGRTLFIGRALD
jgi:GNAT superfamily N-acetyltransferase